MITRNYQKNVRTANLDEIPGRNNKELNLRLWSTPILRKYKSDTKLIDFWLPK